MAAVEGYRSTNQISPVSLPYGKFESSDFSGLDPINPGGPLDFFNVASTPEDLAILKSRDQERSPRDDFDARRLRAGRRHRGGPRHAGASTSPTPSATTSSPSPPSSAPPSSKRWSR